MDGEGEALASKARMRELAGSGKHDKFFSVMKTTETLLCTEFLYTSICTSDHNKSGVDERVSFVNRLGIPVHFSRRLGMQDSK